MTKVEWNAFLRGYASVFQWLIPNIGYVTAKFFIFLMCIAHDYRSIYPAVLYTLLWAGVYHILLRDGVYEVKDT